MTARLRQLSTLSAEQRPAAGQQINAAKKTLAQALAARRAELDAACLAQKLAKETIDVTLPGRRQPLGGWHPVTAVQLRVADFFVRYGFEVVEGPEVEDDFHNFEALNIAKTHPARAMHDVLLR